MQLVISWVDQEADSVGTLKQQIAADSLERGQSLKQEDDNVAEKDKVECQLQKLWERNSWNQDQPERSPTGNE